MKYFEILSLFTALVVFLLIKTEAVVRTARMTPLRQCMNPPFQNHRIIPLRTATFLRCLRTDRSASPAHRPCVSEC